MPLDLRSEENWYGGFYELALELGPRDDRRLDAAVRACWSHPSISTCSRSRDLTDSSARIEPTLRALEAAGHLQGIIDVPGFGETVCGTVAIREDESGIDWLDFYLPIGALETLDERTESLWNPDSTVPYDWRRPFDDLLCEIGARVSAAAGFRLGLIGFEVSGTLYREELEDPPRPRKHVTLLVSAPGGELRRIQWRDEG